MMETRDQVGDARSLKEAFRERLRGEVAEAGTESGGLRWGKVAAEIRKSDFYRKARHVLVPPSGPFFQVRLNALMDRKRLTVPSPGMQSGFQHFDPNRMAQRDLIDLARLRQPGTVLTRASYSSTLEPPIDLVIGEALCGAEDGGSSGTAKGTSTFPAQSSEPWAGWMVGQGSWPWSEKGPSFPFAPRRIMT